MYMIYPYISKKVFLLTINDNNYLCYNIIIYKFDIIILKFLI